jgi:hypothetical protein
MSSKRNGKNVTADEMAENALVTGVKRTPEYERGHEDGWKDGWVHGANAEKTRMIDAQREIRMGKRVREALITAILELKEGGSG